MSNTIGSLCLAVLISLPIIFLSRLRKRQVNKHNMYWFDFPIYDLTGKLSASSSDSSATWLKPTIYLPDSSLLLPYTNITDNTEGISAFDDIDFPRNITSIADFGGGSSNEVAIYMKNKYSNITNFFSLDPFNRSRQHNIDMQSSIVAMGGVDIVTCMSVLNIIPTYCLRLHLISVIYWALKEGGCAYFKVWAGSWPIRGTGKYSKDFVRNIYQANKWADSFFNEVSKVFGYDNVFVDNNMNLIVAKKK